MVPGINPYSDICYRTQIRLHNLAGLVRLTGYSPLIARIKAILAAMAVLGCVSVAHAGDASCTAIDGARTVSEPIVIIAHGGVPPILVLDSAGIPMPYHVTTYLSPTGDTFSLVKVKLTHGGHYTVDCGDVAATVLPL